MQVDEHNAIRNMINEDIKTHDIMRNEMVEFLTKVLGHPNQGWVRLLEARWMKRKRNLTFVEPRAILEKKAPTVKQIDKSL